ncbi:indole-3-glycerol phosphate synthase TrpC [Chitinophaga sp. Mgbs1]|uniref:Indole-3-glycerol phosphate synthase n=1 Tax=Chitinophaga solisilvae TaxID=1233460 RepID=A0A433WN91_9BACT|nr:indole-3-glycerol phosphate synthase TrpC [Chitinophaga solisilvae]
MSILDNIISNTRAEVAQRREQTPVSRLEKYPLFDRTPLRAANYLRAPGKLGIIAEVKRQSPSKGIINADFDAPEVARGYEAAGASCISVLTDQKYFGGSLTDLSRVKAAVQLPVLRKDFIISEYQITEAKAIGADIILLIAAALPPATVASLARFAQQLGLSVLLEVHTLEELQQNLHPEVDLIGVNNRDLHSFEISVKHSLQLAPHIPAQFLRVSESGLTNYEVVPALKQAGYEGFLIGETFMRERDPGLALATYSQELRKALSNAQTVAL